MKCVICHSDNISKKEVLEEIKNDSDIIVVPVKVPVCTNCGERYYDRRTIKKLEEIEEQREKNTLQYKEVGKVLMLESVF